MCSAFNEFNKTRIELVPAWRMREQIPFLLEGMPQGQINVNEDRKESAYVDWASEGNER